MRTAIESIHAMLANLTIRAVAFHHARDEKGRGRVLSSLPHYPFCDLIFTLGHRTYSQFCADITQCRETTGLMLTL